MGGISWGPMMWWRRGKGCGGKVWFGWEGISEGRGFWRGGGGGTMRFIDVVVDGDMLRE